MRAACVRACVIVIAHSLINLLPHLVVTLATTYSDVKSLNILIGREDTAKIADFGTSRLFGRQPTQGRQKTKEGGAAATTGSDTVFLEVADEFNWTQMTSMPQQSDAQTQRQQQRTLGGTQTVACGTLAYMANECLEAYLVGRQLEMLTLKVDVFAFGLVLWEIHTRGELWRGVGGGIKIAKHIVAGGRPEFPTMATTNSLQLESKQATTSAAATTAAAAAARSLAALAVQCWADTPTSRPSFASIVPTLEAMVAALALGTPGNRSQGVGEMTMDQQPGDVTEGEFEVEVAQAETMQELGREDTINPALPWADMGVEEATSHSLPPPGRLLD